MDLVFKIKQLTTQKKLTFSELERRLDFSNGQIAKWKRTTPGIDKIEKVADYFNVSVDYLLGRDKPTEDKYELEAVTMFRKQTENMSDEQKEKFNNSLNKLLSFANDLLDDDSNWKE